jgi:hypothetical protein
VSRVHWVRLELSQFNFRRSERDATAPIAFEIVSGSKPFGPDCFFGSQSSPRPGKQGELDGLVGERNVGYSQKRPLDRSQDRWMASGT